MQFLFGDLAWVLNSVFFILLKKYYYCCLNIYLGRSNDFLLIQKLHLYLPALNDEFCLIIAVFKELIMIINLLLVEVEIEGPIQERYAAQVCASSKYLCYDHDI